MSLPLAQQIAKLESRRDEILGKLESLDAINMDQPNANGSNTVDRVSKIRAWYDELALIREQLAAMQGPVTVETIGIV